MATWTLLVLLLWPDVPALEGLVQVRGFPSIEACEGFFRGMIADDDRSVVTAEHKCVREVGA